MKELRFTTSKGEFLACDAINGANTHTGISLKDITEEQASKVVDEFLFNANDGSDYGDEKVYKDYVTDEIYLTNPIESLYSLLKSKGIHLYENPIDSPECIDGYPDAYLDAIQEDIHLSEEKTFYNPYIFKIN